MKNIIIIMALLLTMCLNLFSIEMSVDTNKKISQNEIINKKDQSHQKKQEANEQLDAYRKIFKKDINELIETLIKKNHVNSIDLLNKIGIKVKIQQEEQIQNFLPDNFSGYTIREKKQPADEYFGQTNYGVLFTQQYNNIKGNTVEINIIHSDESIRDYTELIKNPSLIRGMNNTKLVNNNKYQAIETVSEDKTHHVQNIILNDNLMLTVIGIGMKKSTILEEFITHVEMEQLQAYLE